jgi:hypothetical protein
MQAAEFLDLDNSESPRFLGRVISRLAKDTRLMELSGTVQVAATLGIRYNVQDIDGKQPKPLTIDSV